MLPDWPLREGCGDDNIVSIREAPWGSGDFAVSSMLWFLFHPGNCTTVQWIIGEGRLYDALSVYFYESGI